MFIPGLAPLLEKKNGETIYDAIRRQVRATNKDAEERKTEVVTRFNRGVDEVAAAAKRFGR